jgi:peptide-methionine (S)-S-oxide reductase
MRPVIFFLIALHTLSCQSAPSDRPSQSQASEPINLQALDTATLAGGCFWCVEAAIEQIKGVHEVVSGYSGGDQSTADYRTVSSGRTKHAEAVQVYYDTSIIEFGTILDIFFTAHDPTQLNRQGPDVGPQYRSAIFYHNEAQKQVIDEKIEEWSDAFSQPIVTEVAPLDNFYLAEEYHQDYEKRNPFQPYIIRVSKPKVEKVQRKFPDLIKEGS